MFEFSNLSSVKPESSTPRQAGNSSTWVPPVLGSLKIICDASFKQVQRAGFGCIVRNSVRSVAQAFDNSCPDVSARQAEILTIREAGIFCLKAVVLGITIYWCSKKYLVPPWDCVMIIADIVLNLGMLLGFLLSQLVEMPIDLPINLHVNVERMEYRLWIITLF